MEYGTVKQLHKALAELIEQGKGDYELFCEGGHVPLDVDDMWVNDVKKTIVM